MVKCPDCGKESDSKFCPNCGKNLEKTNVCPNCKSELEENAKFCQECGEKINGKSKEKKNTKPKKEKKSEKTCSHCGEELEKDEIFCSNCGKKIEDKSKEKKNTKPKKEKKSEKTCPHCGEELEKDEIFCSSCGKKIEVDENSFGGMLGTIDYKKLIISSIIGFLISFILSILLSAIAGLIGFEAYTYPLAIILATAIGVWIAASSFKDLLNAGLVGIVVGFFTGLLSNTSIEISSGFKYSYELFSGYEIIIFTVIGFVIAVATYKFLGKYVLKYIDIGKLI